MEHPAGLEGMPFPVLDPQINESCIDYWFDEDEIEEVSSDRPIVPDGFRAIARDPGDDLIALAPNGSVFYLTHDTGRSIQLADSIAKFYETFGSD